MLASTDFSESSWTGSGMMEPMYPPAPSMPPAPAPMRDEPMSAPRPKPAKKRKKPTRPKARKKAGKQRPNARAKRGGFFRFFAGLGRGADVGSSRIGAGAGGIETE